MISSRSIRGMAQTAPLRPARRGTSVGMTLGKKRRHTNGEFPTLCFAKDGAPGPWHHELREKQGLHFRVPRARKVRIESPSMSARQ